MIRIALIGCKNATADYGDVAARLQGAGFAAVVDPDDTLARRAAETLDAPLSAATFEDLLRDNADDFDAVVVRGTSGSPRSIVAQAAQAGKHVLLEMPLLLRMPQDESPREACRSAGVLFMPGQVKRFLPSIVEVEQCLRSGILGAPGLLRIHDWKPPEGNEPTPPEAEPPGAMPTVFEAVLPDVDLANWLFNALPTEIHAAGHAEKKGTGPICRTGPEGASHKLDLSPFSYVQLHLGYPEGGMALIDRSMTLPAGSSYFALSAFGSAGAAYADDHHNMHLHYGGGRPAALSAGQGNLHHLAELQEFVDAVETGRPPAIAAEDGHNAAKVVRAAARSLESGRALQLIGSHYEFV